MGLLGGIYLAGLPTYYALFTVGDVGASASDARTHAVPLFAVWLAVALIVGYIAVLQDGQLLRLLLPHRRRIKHAREYDAVLNVVKLLLTDERFSILRPFDPTVFVCDDPQQPTQLEPLFNPPGPEWKRWKIGYGAVGAAFERNTDEVFVFRGEYLRTQNETLTPEQIRVYGNLKLVVAYRLQGADGRPIGVLGASSEVEEQFTHEHED